MPPKVPVPVPHIVIIQFATLLSAQVSQSVDSANKQTWCQEERPKNALGNLSTKVNIHKSCSGILAVDAKTYTPLPQIPINSGPLMWAGHLLSVHIVGAAAKLPLLGSHGDSTPAYPRK